MDERECPHVETKGSDHYKTGDLEVFDVMRAKMTFEQFYGFILGNVIKYSLRINFVEAHRRASDAKKLEHYSDVLERLEQERCKRDVKPEVGIPGFEGRSRKCQTTLSPSE